MLQKFDRRYGNFPAPVIFGLSGTTLTADEKAFLKDANPLGIILFKRNCDTPDQISTLTASVFETLGRVVPVLIDQEGGRVQRLSEPHWKPYPPAREYGLALTRNFANGKQFIIDTATEMANDLTAIGISVNCAPVMDITYAETDDSIGDRSISKDPYIVSTVAGNIIRTYAEHGVIPVAKHLPGQGRATHDSHKDLPVIDATPEEMRRSDYLPYKELSTKTYNEALWGMVAHVIYNAYDSRVPASCSRRVIWDAIRGDVGFNGLLISDDICMDALSGYGEAKHRAKAVNRAGCDIILHCDGNLDDMKAIMTEIPEKMPLTSVERFNLSVGWVNRNSKNKA